MNKNTVTRETLEDMIVTTRFIVDGTLTVAILTLTNGFKMVGKSACVDACNFDKRTGEVYAKEDAIEQMWVLAGFALAESLTKN